MRLRASLLLGAALAGLVALAAARRLIDLVYPFLVALFVAAVIDPVVDRLERRGVPRPVAALAVIAAAVLGGVSLLWVLLANVAAELALLLDQLPSASAYIESWAARTARLFGPLLSAAPHPLDDALKDLSRTLLGALMEWAAQGLSRIGALSHLPAVVAVSGMAAYFLSRDKRELGNFLMSLLPRGWRREVRRLKEEIAAGLIGYVRAQSVLVAVTGALSIAGLTLFGYRYAWLLGGLAGLLDVVPLVGPSAVYAPLVAVGVAAGDWPRALGVGALWAGLLLLRQLIEPEMVARHAGLHPLTSIAAVYVGGKLFGINGVLLGPVFAVTLKAVCSVSVLPYFKQD